MTNDQPSRESDSVGGGGHSILSEDEKAAITKEVEARMDGYVEAARRRDIDWFLDFWADEDGFAMAGDGNLMDRDTWVQWLRQAVADTREILNMELFNRHRYVLGRDAAAHSTQFRWAYDTMSGDTLRSHGSWTYVFKNFDGVWRVIHSGGHPRPGMIPVIAQLIQAGVCEPGWIGGP